MGKKKNGTVAEDEGLPLLARAVREKSTFWELTPVCSSSTFSRRSIVVVCVVIGGADKVRVRLVLLHVTTMATPAPAHHKQPNKHTEEGRRGEKHGCNHE